MEFDYEAEKRKLGKKLIILLVVATGFTVLFRVAMGEEVSLPSCILTGVLLGFVFYIPGRLKEHMKLGWLSTVIIAVIFVFILMWLSDMLGQIVLLIALLLPLADIGYSIYRLASVRKNMQQSE